MPFPAFSARRTLTHSAQGHSMTLSVYKLTIPALLRGFDVLSSYIEKAAEHARANDIDPTTLIEARLAPDMLTFAGQIQRASDKSKNGISRLTGVEPPRFDDTETSFYELQARIAKTVDFLMAVDAASFAGSDTKPIEIKFRSINGVFTGESYATKILLPDFYFHVATAHGLLRSKGVSIGKADYLGRLS
jgi:hypothetical protein